MSVKIGTATDYLDLLNQLDTFLTGTGMALTPAFTGTGNGAITGVLGGSAGVAETFTITFTSATAFSVVGSVSGTLSAGVAGTPYTSTKVNFLITSGGTAFIAGDHFVFAVTPPWTSKRRVSSSEMIWQAPGNGGLDAIIVGAQEFHDAGADYWNWRLGGFTAFDPAIHFNDQAGYVGSAFQSHPSPVLNLWNSTIPYWFVANGRRVIIVAKVSTVYVTCYLGLLNSYMSPGAFPYPLVVGGSMAWQNEPASNSVNWRWSYSGDEMRNFPIPFKSPMSFAYQSSLRLRLTTGVWQGFDISGNEGFFGSLWPNCHMSQTSQDWRTDLDGGYSLLPVVLFDTTPNSYGELEGVTSVAGFQNSAENTVTINGIAHLVVPNVFRGGNADYFAVRLS